MLFTFFVQWEFLFCDMRCRQDSSRLFTELAESIKVSDHQHQQKKTGLIQCFLWGKTAHLEFSVVGSIPFLEGACIHSREFSTFTSSSQFPFNATSASRDFPFMDERMSKQYKRKKKEGTNRELSTAGVVQQLLSSVTACCSLHAQQRGKGATKLRRL
jgi:hypothetical protein